MARNGGRREARNAVRRAGRNADRNADRNESVKQKSIWQSLNQFRKIVYNYCQNYNLILDRLYHQLKQ